MLSHHPPSFKYYVHQPSCLLSIKTGAHTAGVLLKYPEKCQAAAGQFKIATTNFSLQGGKGGGCTSDHPSQNLFASLATAASIGSTALVGHCHVQLFCDFLIVSTMVWWGSNFISCNVPASLNLNTVGTEQGQGTMEMRKLDTEQHEKSCQQRDQERKFLASID